MLFEIRMPHLLAVVGLLLAFSLPSIAQTKVVPLSGPAFAPIVEHTSSELKSLLSRADELARSTNFSSVDPVTFVLHGEEINFFRRDNYGDNSALVDLAARLDAFQVIDVRVCETWLRDNQVLASDLPPFVELVPFGPAFQASLQRDGAVEF